MPHSSLFASLKVPVLYMVMDYLLYGKTSVKRPLKIDKTKVLMTTGSLMKVESIAECSLWSILQYF